MSTPADFWARRKAAVQAEEVEEIAASQERIIQAERAVLEAKEDTEILAELDLPDPDTLKIGDDVRGFMAQAVPDRLRRRALRQLWRVNPVLANIDGLVDYGEDFTDAACVIENLQTTYQVGKGMLAHVQEMARQAEAEAVAEAESDTLPIPGDSPAEPEEEAVAVIAPPNEIPREPSQDIQHDMAHLPEDPEATPTVPAPRRMRFDFER